MVSNSFTFVLSFKRLSYRTTLYCEYYPRYVSFGSIDGAEVVLITSNFDPVTVAVKTSLSKLTGTISLPDTITYLSLSEYDTLYLGESITISWSGSNADFFLSIVTVKEEIIVVTIIILV